MSFIIALFMKDLLEASFEINKPVKFGWNKPICKVQSGLCGSSHVSSVVEEHRPKPYSSCIY